MRQTRLTADLPKIFAFDIPAALQPQSTVIRYPPGTSDWGVEQDFFWYLTHEYPSLVDKPEDADWLYLGIYWTRIHLANGYGKTGIEELRDAVARFPLLHGRVFTVCQYDDGPLVDLGATRVYLASRKSSEFGRDCPLLAFPPPRPRIMPGRRYLASFLGRLDTHEFRKVALEPISMRADCFVYDGLKSQRFYRKILRQSWIALAPRGYGGSSFRFYEAIFAGAVPWLIGDLDTRPFKNQIDWDDFSFYSTTPEDFAKDFAELNFEVVRKKSAQLGNLRKMLRSSAWNQHLIRDLSNP